MKARKKENVTSFSTPSRPWRNLSFKYFTFNILSSSYISDMFFISDVWKLSVNLRSLEWEEPTFHVFFLDQQVGNTVDLLILRSAKCITNQSANPERRKNKSGSRSGKKT